MRRRFTGDYDTSRKVSFWDVLKWKLTFYKMPKQDRDFCLPMHKEDLQIDEDFICWLSHASFLIQIGKKRIVIDLVTGDIPFYKRYTPFPYTLDALLPIDYLLISHTHYDHFDTPSLRELSHKATYHAIVPLGMEPLFRRKIGWVPLTELGWFQTYVCEELSITFVPAMHWSRRGICDTNTVLWGGFVIQYGEKTVYFAGDTAYGEHFGQIGKRFDIDYALLPVGAYRPETIMRYNHMDPHEAMLAMKTLQARAMIPMHYGTFRLSDETLEEQVEYLQSIQKILPDRIFAIGCGEIMKI